ncbi:MAG: mandelate racemase/muconate lactonizing enzyme family protein [Deltaproteobacteria bacterium]|nr:mandelate racemase/muconate lactonizing enzyme family protein [Deltaproteobacteria bacterium]
MKIRDIECFVLQSPQIRKDATSSAQDDIVVLVHTDEGITGVGETDTGPFVARAAIEAPGTHTMALGMKELLIGADPFDTSALWQKLYTYTCMTGRRGAVIAAMGAIDMALWDIKGKATGLPTYKLMGGAHRPGATPYASLQPYGNTVREYGDSLIDWIERVKAAGFRAAKCECTLAGPYRHAGLSGTDEQMTEILTACRKAAGRDFTLMVDVQYRWWDVHSCLRTLRDWGDLDLFFVETPLQIDNLAGYAHLATHAPMRIAAGEWQNTRFEFADLIHRGQLAVVQPDVGRVGGLTEALRVCHMAEDHGRLVVPHCWKTGIGIAASVHMALSQPHVPFVEYVPADMSDSPLRRDLLSVELTMKDGLIHPPTRPGLGIELDMKALQRFAVQ